MMYKKYYSNTTMERWKTFKAAAVLALTCVKYFSVYQKPKSDYTYKIERVRK